MTLTMVLGLPDSASPGLCLFACLIPARLPTCLFTYVSDCLSACHPVCLFTCVSDCLSAFLPVCLPVSLIACLPTCLPVSLIAYND